MSLDVYLYGSPVDITCTCDHCGNEHRTIRSEPVYYANITHNLNNMADAVGLYQYLWRPDEHNITTARQLINPLLAGITELKSYPEKYRLLEPANKWGTYDDFIPWLERYLRACREYPDAAISVSR